MLPQPSQQNNFYFTTALLAWFDINGRKNLPWQNPRTPYRVWLSEVMLQQTQVKTVIPYFLKFIARFPTLEILSQATEDEVLAYWSGLGYYSRGRNLQKTAHLITTQFDGVFPDTVEALTTLPGIGESTAAAILSLAFNKPAAILDGNVKRILSRYFLIEGNPNTTQTKKNFLRYAVACLPTTRAADYTQAIMDLGALICTPKKPSCNACPLNLHCLANSRSLTSIYPEKILKKALPTREAQFILMHNQTRSVIYLEKQPSKGLWGGLWSLPKIDKNDCAITYVQKMHALQVHTSIPLPMLKHTFTHFKLHLYPIEIGVQSLALNQILPQNGRWVDVSKIDKIGIPKPIQCIIQRVLK